MIEIKFPAKDVLNLIADRSSLRLVKKHGVYLVGGPDDKMLYAEGYDPEKEPLDEWRSRAQKLSSYDFVEELAISDKLKELLAQNSRFFVKVSEKHIRYGVAS